MSQNLDCLEACRASEIKNGHGMCRGKRKRDIKQSSCNEQDYENYINGFIPNSIYSLWI